jgi:hypothetical protein
MVAGCHEELLPTTPRPRAVFAWPAFFLRPGYAHSGRERLSCGLYGSQMPEGKKTDFPLASWSLPGKSAPIKNDYVYLKYITKVSLSKCQIKKTVNLDG